MVPGPDHSVNQHDVSKSASVGVGNEGQNNSVTYTGLFKVMFGVSLVLFFILVNVFQTGMSYEPNVSMIYSVITVLIINIIVFGVKVFLGRK